MKSEAPTILLVSNYFPPERGAAPNRIQMMATALLNAGYRVEVVCPLPNYPTGKVFPKYRGKLYSKSVVDGVEVHRLWIWPSKSTNKFIRLGSMLSFSLALGIFFLVNKIPERVLIQYSPVFVGATAVFWSSLFGKKIILNVSDLWPLAGLEMGLLQRGTYYSVLERMEHFCYHRSHLILGQSEEILSHVSKIAPNASVQLYRNIPAFTPPAITKRKQDNSIKIVYAGLLGVAQGLSHIFNQITLPENVEIHIYGDGPDTKQLMHPNNLNIVYHGTLPRTLLHQELELYDLAFIPLVRRIYGSVPSKVFEYSRLGLPLLYMAGGEGAALVRDHKLGWVIDVADYAGLEAFLRSLSPSVLNDFTKEEVQGRSVKAFNFGQQFRAVVQKIDKL